MVVTINQDVQDALHSKSFTEPQVGRDILIVPGNTLSFSLRVTASMPIQIIDILADGTIVTEKVHGLQVGDPVHLTFNSGVSVAQLTPYIKVKAVVDPNRFTIEDSSDPAVQVVIAKEIVLDKVTKLPLPAASQPIVTGWVAKAANLQGFTGAVILDLDTGRRDQMLGNAAIKAGGDQLQIKGAFDIRKGDSIKLGSYEACVIMASQFKSGSTCYTVAQMTKKAETGIPFTDNLLATLNPYEPVIQAVGYGDAWGWVSVTMPGSKTILLDDYRKPTKDSCPMYIGKFRHELRGYSVEYPSWFTHTPQVESTFTRIFDYGNIWI